MQNKYQQLLKKLIRHSVTGIFVQWVVLASAFASVVIFKNSGEENSSKLKECL